jgi:gas vesicle protein
MIVAETGSRPAEANSVTWESIPNEAYGMIGALIGAIIGVSGTILTMVIAPRMQKSLEEAKLMAARHELIHKELGNRLHQLGADLASAGHSMCWIAWACEHDAISAEYITEYNKEMHIVLPKIAGGIVSVRALDKELGDFVNGLATKLHRLDSQIGQVCLLFANDPIKAKEQFLDLSHDIRQFESAALTELGDRAFARTSRLLSSPLFSSKGP